MNAGRLYILKSNNIARVAFAVAISLFLSVELLGQSLVISEIHYHPLPEAIPPGSPTQVDGDEFEFLEIRNDGASAFDLNGCSLSGGITYTFSASLVLAPGESTVIVENQLYFAYRYPWVTRVAGQYGGKLSNGGESLVLRNSSGSPVFSVTYDDEGGWPEGADGDGRSLMLSNPVGDPDDPANWCASAELHGSPAEAGTCHFSDVVLNEILAHSDPPLEDAIELYNKSGAAVDLNGWYLSDDFIDPKKYQITGTVIAADGYTVIYEYQFNAGSNPFALSSLGDELILTAPFPDENRLRLVDRLDFGATATDVSLGRFPNGSGGFTILKSLTFGTTNPSTVEEFRTGEGAFNSTPKVGPVVINEIMYHPYQDDETSYEYIELLNVSDVTWDISGWMIDGVNYTNPPGTFIAPGEFLVVCADHVAISSAYGIANVVGDWPGALQNGGERIVLMTDEGAVIDSVRYNDKEPWPVGADGYGASLERLRSAEDGDTYMNWGASSMGTGWQYVALTQSVTSAGADVLKFWLDHEGKCYIDDVSLQPLGGGSELIADGDFELGGASWSSVGNHNSSRVELGAGRSGSAGLVVVGNFTRILHDQEAFIYYGDGLSNHVASDEYSLAVGDYILSYWIQRGTQGMNLSYNFGGVEHTYGLGSYGTPGISNSEATGLSPLGIADVDAVSNVVATTDSNIIRARVEGVPGGASVKLFYRTVTTNSYQYTDVHYSELTMSDNGVLPDITSGDGEYAATVPAAGAGWAIVRYHVEALATNGVAARSPGVSNPTEDYGYWVQDDPVQTVVPNWHIFSDGSPVVYSNSFRCCAVSPEGDVYADVRVRHRGNPPSSLPEAETLGVALRMNRGNPCDTFFAKNQEGINFRHRINDSVFWYSRVVNEYLAYHLQQKVGLVTPYHRHTCLWMNGDPFITIELESPETGFLELHDLDNEDYLSRVGNAGRRFIDGDESLDNFDDIMELFGNASGAAQSEGIRTNLWYENIRYSMAQMSIISSVSQYFNWNMFQHRSASDRRWTQYPWDSDKTFVSEFSSKDMTELHPYYSTPDHPFVWDVNSSELLSKVLFYPEDSIYTLPYRYRHQMTLWRFCHTLFTTNYIYSILDGVQADLSPAYVEIGVDLKYLEAAVERVKAFTENRRDFLLNDSWSDKDTNIWGAEGVYDPSTVVISEIMYDPGVGGEYLELYNNGSNTVDLSWWLVCAGDECYRLPHGTMLAPESELVIVDTFSVLTNSYPGLNSGNTIERYPGMPIWDWPMVFLSANEYSTRVVDIPTLTLPNAGASIELYDICSNLVDAVTYSAVAPWPQTQGAALELVSEDLDNALPSSWRRSFTGGTPATHNTAGADLDGDGLIDTWETQINADIEQVSPGGDGDGDLLTNEREFALGTDPTGYDDGLAFIDIWIENGEVVVGFNTIPVSGVGYDFYSSRLYTLEQSESLHSVVWSNVTGHVELPGNGYPVVYTNVVPAERMFYRYKVRLE